MNWDSFIFGVIVGAYLIIFYVLFLYWRYG